MSNELILTYNSLPLMRVSCPCLINKTPYECDAHTSRRKNEFALALESALER